MSKCISMLRPNRTSRLSSAKLSLRWDLPSDIAPGCPICSLALCVLIWFFLVNPIWPSGGGRHIVPHPRPPFPRPVNYLRMGLWVMGTTVVFGLRANMRRSGLKKLTFLSYEFGKGQYTFYPVKLSRSQKKESSSEITKFHKGGPLQNGSNAKCLSSTSKVSSQTIFLRVLSIQTSWILLKMENHSQPSHFQKE